MTLLLFMIIINFNNYKLINFHFYLKTFYTVFYAVWMK